MRLHHGELSVCQPSGLTKNWRELFVDLADVVKQCSHCDAIDSLGSDASRVGYNSNVRRDTLRVAGGVRISRLNRRYEKLKELFTLVLKLSR